MKYSIPALIGAVSLFLRYTTAYNFDDHDRVLQRTKDMEDTSPLTERDANRFRSLIQSGRLKVITDDVDSLPEAENENSSYGRALKRKNSIQKQSPPEGRGKKNPRAEQGAAKVGRAKQGTRAKEGRAEPDEAKRNAPPPPAQRSKPQSGAQSQRHGPPSKHSGRNKPESGAQSQRNGPPSKHSGRNKPESGAQSQRNGPPAKHSGRNKPKPGTQSQRNGPPTQQSSGRNKPPKAAGRHHYDDYYYDDYYYGSGKGGGKGQNYGDDAPIYWDDDLFWGDDGIGGGGGGGLSYTFMFFEGFQSSLNLQAAIPPNPSLPDDFEAGTTYLYNQEPVNGVFNDFAGNSTSGLFVDESDEFATVTGKCIRTDPYDQLDVNYQGRAYCQFVYTFLAADGFDFFVDQVTAEGPIEIGQSAVLVVTGGTEMFRRTVGEIILSPVEPEPLPAIEFAFELDLPASYYMAAYLYMDSDLISQAVF